LRRVTVVQMLYSVRSERELMEQGAGWVKTAGILRQVKVRMRSLGLLRPQSVQDAGIA